MTGAERTQKCRQRETEKRKEKRNQRTRREREARSERREEVKEKENRHGKALQALRRLCQPHPYCCLFDFILLSSLTRVAARALLLLVLLVFFSDSIVIQYRLHLQVAFSPSCFLLLPHAWCCPSVARFPAIARIMTFAVAPAVVMQRWVPDSFPSAQVPWLSGGRPQNRFQPHTHIAS